MCPISDICPREERTVAQAMKDGGYATWHVGKWHLGGPGFYPDEHGFEVNVGGCEHGSPGRGGYFSPWTIPVLDDLDVPDGTYLTDYLTDRVVDLIENRDDRPFFLNLWYYTVHTPIQAKRGKDREVRRESKSNGLWIKSSHLKRAIFSRGNTKRTGALRGGRCSPTRCTRRDDREHG